MVESAQASLDRQAFTWGMLLRIAPLAEGGVLLSGEFHPFDRHQKDSWFRERCLSARRSRARALSSPRASLGVEEMKIEAQPILLSFKWPPAERSTLQPSA